MAVCHCFMELLQIPLLQSSLRALCIMPNNLFKKQAVIYKYVLNYLQK